jgi:ADP-ribose pyrophosphatase YjhB (NUDIX family)
MNSNVTRRSARAVLIDSSDLLLIKRTRPEQAPYWVTIGGGVEPEDSSLEDAVRREVLEEIGAQIKNVAQILIIKDPVEDGIAIQHIFLAELAPTELVDPTGKELSIPSRGGYELVRVPFTADGIGGIDLKPSALADYLISTHDALLASLGYPVMNPTTREESGGEDVDDRVHKSEWA